MKKLLIISLMFLLCACGEEFTDRLPLKNKQLKDESTGKLYFFTSDNRGNLTVYEVENTVKVPTLMSKSDEKTSAFELEHLTRSLVECKKEKDQDFEKGFSRFNLVVANKDFLSNRLEPASKCAYWHYKQGMELFNLQDVLLPTCLKKCSKKACDEFYEYFKRNIDFEN